jgi:hypothetical protein
MALTIEVDFQHGFAVPEVTRADDGRHRLTLTRDQERVIVQLSLASLDALRHELAITVPALVDA